MNKEQKYNKLCYTNRDGLVRIVKTPDFEKDFRDFDVSRLHDASALQELLGLYANVMSEGISKELGLRVSPFIRQNVVIDGGLNYNLFGLCFIRGGRNFWTKHNGDCIVTSEISIKDTVVISNKLTFDSYSYIIKNADDTVTDDVLDDLTDPFYDVIQGISDSFAEKTDMKYDHAYVADGHPNPMTMGVSPMSYKIYYYMNNGKHDVIKNKK